MRTVFQVGEPTLQLGQALGLPGLNTSHHLRCGRCEILQQVVEIFLVHNIDWPLERWRFSNCLVDILDGPHRYALGLSIDEQEIWPGTILAVPVERSEEGVDTRVLGVEPPGVSISCIGRGLAVSPYQFIELPVERHLVVSARITEQSR